MNYILTLFIAIVFLQFSDSNIRNMNPVAASVSIPFFENTSYSASTILAKQSTQKINQSVKNKKYIGATKEVFDHSLFNSLLKKHVDKNGSVNYAGIKKDQETLRKYLYMIGTYVPDITWSENEKLAYYLNAYNAMTIDLIIKNYPTKSIKDIHNPWEQRNWKIGEKSISLEEIEHEILRKMKDPRIHFGINCASFSCPPLMNEAFTASKVVGQLERLTVQFINDSKRNKITTYHVEISKIFKWFKEDFTKNGDLIDFLNTYSKVKIEKNARVRYMDYHWELNE
jgi:hypothetical protein